MKLSDTLLQCLKGITSTQKDGTRIGMIMGKILPCWHLTKEQWGSTLDSAYRQRGWIPSQSKETEVQEDWRLCSLRNCRSLLPSSLHTSSPCLPRTSPHIPVPFSTLAFISPITINKSPRANLLTVSWSLKKNSSLLYTLFHFCYFHILVLLYFYYSPVLQLFHYWISATQVSSCVWVWRGNQIDLGANSATKLVPGGTNLAAVWVLEGPT